ncbi:hypothetical protein GCM10028864_26600 [Microlunatus parietis]
MRCRIKHGDGSDVDLDDVRILLARAQDYIQRTDAIAEASLVRGDAVRQLLADWSMSTGNAERQPTD